MYIPIRAPQFIFQSDSNKKAAKMSSADSGDRSISSGINLPHWIKTKMGDQYDLEQAAFSPAVDDGSFFFVRYPRAMHQPDFGDLCNNVKPKVVENKQSSIPCQRFLAEIQAESSMTTNATTFAGTSDSMANIDNKLVSIQSYNEYKPEKPSLSTSSSTGSFHRTVVDVAHDVGGGLLGLGRSVADKSNMQSHSILANIDNKHLLSSSYNLNQRRNSKSLPASPLSSPNTSPKLRRRNPYFSDPFRKSNDNFGKAGWLLSNILSQRTSVENLASTSGTEVNSNSEQATTESPGQRRRHQHSNSNHRSTCESISETSKPTSELREMNFWSPTSM